MSDMHGYHGTCHGGPLAGQLLSSEGKTFTVELMEQSGPAGSGMGMERTGQYRWDGGCFRWKSLH